MMGLLPRRTPDVRAFSFAETLMSIVIVSGLLVVSLNSVGASKAGQQTLGERGVGQLLGAALMSEIMSLPYRDPDGGTVLGIELGELAGSRPTFDDVDDYDGHNESPPKNKNGSVIPGRSSWHRAVTVDYVNPNTFETALLIDTGAKRIIVTVTHNAREVCTLTALRTDGPGGRKLSIGPVKVDPEIF